MSNSKKPYNVNLGFIPDFYIPHPESNHLNAQDCPCVIGTST